MLDEKYRPQSQGLGSPGAPSELMSLQELSVRWAIPLGTLYKWRAAGKGPQTFRLGKYVRVRVRDVEAWEQAQLEKEQAAHAG